MKNFKIFSLAITMSFFYIGNAQNNNLELIEKINLTDKPKIIFRSQTILKPALIIIDDKIENDSILNTIDPKIIEKINVLKGEKALNEYGNMGQNGVIVIKTKKKSAEKKEELITN